MPTSALLKRGPQMSTEITGRSGRCCEVLSCESSRVTREAKACAWIRHRHRNDEGSRDPGQEITDDQTRCSTTPVEHHDVANALDAVNSTKTCFGVYTCKQSCRNNSHWILWIGCIG